MSPIPGWRKTEKLKNGRKLRQAIREGWRENKLLRYYETGVVGTFVRCLLVDDPGHVTRQYAWHEVPSQQ
jgi:hypothetical protein